MSQRRHRVRPLVAAGVLTTVALVWFMVAFVYPRVHELRPMPELTGGIEFQGLDSLAVDSVLARRAEIFLSRPSNVGIVIGVIVGERRHLVARGRTDTRPGARPVDGNTLFKLASVSKPLAGILLAEAVLRGELSLDQPIDSVLPAVYASPELRKRHITLRQLATHSSGLPEAPPGLPIWSPLWAPREKTEAELAHSLTEALLEHQHPPAPFGYSSFGFMLLGRALEQASGRRYAQLLREDLCLPLGMRDTWVELTEPVRARMAMGHANGRAVALARQQNIRFPTPGAVVSSPNDMLALIQANLHPERSSIGPALRLAATVQGPERRGERLGLAWFIETDSAGWHRIHHPGAATGFWSFVGFSPEADVGVVVLVNSRDPSASALGENLLSGLTRASRSANGART